MTLIEIPWGGQWYRQELALRDRLLRSPLGLNFSDQEIADEVRQWHFGVLEQERLVACAVVVPDLPRSRAKLRQMAVASDAQGRGLGSDLIRHIEDCLCQRGIDTVELNARQAAIGFYRRLGYVPVGEEFIEVSLPHRKMSKALRTDRGARGGH